MKKKSPPQKNKMDTGDVFGVLSETENLIPDTGFIHKNPDGSETLIGQDRIISWGVETYEDLEQYRSDMANNKSPKPIDTSSSFKRGDLLTVFNTISDGEVLWSGKVKHCRKETPLSSTSLGQNLGQKDIDGVWVHTSTPQINLNEWEAMFYSHSPATVKTVDGKIIHGCLEPFCETGTEGVIWSVQEYGKQGYEGLHCLDDGDDLTVYKTVTDGEIYWRGVVDFKEYPTPLNEQNGFRKFTHSFKKDHEKLSKASLSKYPARVSKINRPR